MKVADDISLCTWNSKAKEMEMSSSAEAEVVEEAGNSPSPFSASEEEGVSRSAEVSYVLYNYNNYPTTRIAVYFLSSLPPSRQTNSDAYLADASLMSSDDSDFGSKVDGVDSIDFGFPSWTKKKTLLDRIKEDKELTPPVSEDHLNY